MIEPCVEHTGCLARIDNLEADKETQWVKIDGLREEIKQMLTRMNVILGGIATACFLLALDIILKR